MGFRVVQFTGSFHQGGSERQAVQLARLFRNAGEHEVFLVTLDRTGVLLDEKLQREFPDIPEFQLESFFSFDFLKKVRACARFLKEKKIDIVHTHDFYSNILGMFAARYAGVPVRIASKRETKGMRTAMQERVERLAYRMANAVTVNAIAVEKYLYERGVPRNKVHLTYNGLNLDRLVPKTTDRNEICEMLGLDPEKRFVTLVANLRHSVKNQPMFVRCAKRLKESAPDVRFVFAGEGERKSFLIDFASKLGVSESCVFLDRCESVPELLNISDVCVLTSYAEGFSNSILEYMAASRPVVATDVGGARECIVDGETGFLVASDDDEAMAAKLELLLNDGKMASRMGDAGREVIEARFSSEIQYQEVKGLYESLLR